MPVRLDASLSTKMPACLRGSRESAAFMWFASDKQQASPRLRPQIPCVVQGMNSINPPFFLPHNTETGNACHKDVFDCPCRPWDPPRPPVASRQASPTTSRSPQAYTQTRRAPTEPCNHPPPRHDARRRRWGHHRQVEEGASKGLWTWRKTKLTRRIPRKAPLPLLLPSPSRPPPSPQKQLQQQQQRTQTQTQRKETISQVPTTWQRGRWWWCASSPACSSSPPRCPPPT